VSCLLYNLGQIHVANAERAGDASDEPYILEGCVKASSKLSMAAVKMPPNTTLSLPAGVKLNHPGVKFSALSLFNAVMAQGGCEGVRLFAPDMCFANVCQRCTLRSYQCSELLCIAPRAL
jgi:hypothetical protein